MYKLQYSTDGVTWKNVTESACVSVASTSNSRRDVTRERLQDIYREAEFHSHRYPHVRVIHDD